MYNVYSGLFSSNRMYQLQPAYMIDKLPPPHPSSQRCRYKKDKKYHLV